MTTNAKVREHKVLTCNRCDTPLVFAYDRWRCPNNCEKHVTYEATPKGAKANKVLSEPRKVPHIRLTLLSIQKEACKLKTAMGKQLRTLLADSPHIPGKDYKERLEQLSFRCGWSTATIENVLDGYWEMLESWYILAYYIGAHILLPCSPAVHYTKAHYVEPQMVGINIDKENTHVKKR